MLGCVSSFTDASKLIGWDCSFIRVFPLKFSRLIKISWLVTVFLVATVSRSHGIENGDEAVLSLFGGDDSLVTTSRIPRPTSCIAENVTIITAEQIAAINAHSLAEVLNTVPGIQLEQVRTPGAWTDFSLQGAASGHLQLLIDGVPQGNLLQNQIDPGLVSVQKIERVEIIKGAASTAWGQALGGVINVITKAPNPDKAFSGTVVSSVGERFTTDVRTEFSGTLNRFGYYVSGSNLHSDGLLHNNGINKDNFYAKFNLDLPKGSLTFGTDYTRAKRGHNETINTHDGQRNEDGYSFLNFNYPLAHLLNLDIDLRESRKSDVALWNDFVNGVVIPYREFHLSESTLGTSAKLSWGDKLTNLVSGVEFEHAETRQWEVIAPDSPFLTNRTWNRWGIFSNGAVSFGPLTILPGVRFDHTGIVDDALSYSLGATFSLTDKTLLRSYYAHGYSLPNAIWDNGPQKVRTFQAGFETGDVPYLWIKGTYFRNDLSNVEVVDANPDSPGATLRKQVKEGFEVEARTVPVADFFLSGGYTFIDARDKATGARLHDLPEHGAKFGLHYNNSGLGLGGVLTGNWVRWNADPANGAKDNTVLWDLSLTDKLFPKHELSPELFFSIHNIFDQGQYLKSWWQNTGRWVEGGARFKF